MKASSNLSGADSTTFEKTNLKRRSVSTCNSLDASMDETITTTTQMDKFPNDGKIKLFKKSNVSVEHNFSVNFLESHIESDLENTSNVSNSKYIFRSKKLTPVDQFNFTSNEGEDSTFHTTENYRSRNDKTEEVDSLILDKSASSSNFGKHSNKKSNIKTSLFKKSVLPNEDFQISFSETIEQSNNTIVNLENKLSTENGKVNPFLKTDEKITRDAFQVDFDESTFSNDSSHSNVNVVFRSRNSPKYNFDVTYVTPTSSKIDKKSDSRTLTLEKNIVEECISKNDICLSQSIPTIENQKKCISEKNIELNESTPSIENEEIRSVTSEIRNTIDKSFEDFNSSIDSNKITIESVGTEANLDQTSYNDDNLKGWMSDPSEAEISAPSVPAAATESPPKGNHKNSESISKENNIFLSWEEKVKDIISNFGKRSFDNGIEKTSIDKTISKKPKIISKQPLKTPKQKPRIKYKKKAPFVTMKLHHYLVDKLKPKFGIDAIIQTDQLLSSLSEAVKIVTRRKNYQRKIISDLKKEMALAGVIETTVDFYEFVINFLPNDFRKKVVPCLNPVTNTVYPPRDVSNPFDKIL